MPQHKTPNPKKPSQNRPASAAAAQGLDVRRHAAAADPAPNRLRPLATERGGAGHCGGRDAAWGALCLLFWQGSWQLLYHPAAAVTRTPASVGSLRPGRICRHRGRRDATERLVDSRRPRARYSRYTALYLHGQDGNLGDTVDDLAALHPVGVNVLAFDYRGYGQSQFAAPARRAGARTRSGRWII